MDPARAGLKSHVMRRVDALCELRRTATHTRQRYAIPTPTHSTQHGRASNHARRYPVSFCCIMINSRHANSWQEHLSARRLLRGAPGPAMRADQDHGAQGGRSKSHTALPRRIE